MLNVILGLHPETQKLWWFHWDGKRMTPFTAAEQKEWSDAERDKIEKRWADILNSGWKKTDDDDGRAT